MRHSESSFEHSVENRDWEELIRIYDPLVRGRVHRLLRDARITPEPEAVDERAQEVYCRLLTGGPRRLTAHVRILH